MKPNLLPAGLALFLAAGVQASAQTPSVGNDQPSIKLRVRIPDNATGTQFTVKSSQGFTSVKMDPRVRITLLPATNPLPPGSNADGFNESGIHQDTGTAYNPGGFNAKGFNSTGIHQTTGTLYDSAGFNAAGFNNSGFNATGIHQATGTLYDSAGFNAAGFNNSGFNATGIHEATGTPYNAAGFNASGYNTAGFNAANLHQATGNAFNPAGFDARGFNASGFNATGIHQATGTPYNAAGFNAAGYNTAGFNAANLHQATGNAFNPAGFNARGFNTSGFNAAGIHQATGLRYDSAGFDAAGYDRAGFDSLGFNAAGYNAAGFNAAGYNVDGFNAVGVHQATGTPFNPAGFNAAGFNARGFNAAGNHQVTGSPFDPAGFNMAGFDVAGFDAAGNNAGGFNRAELRGYPNSQAEALRIGYGIRSGDAPPNPQWRFDAVSRWISKAVINGVEFDTSSYARVLEFTYHVHDPLMAARVAAELGIVYNVGDPLAAYELNNVLSPVLQADIQAAFGAAPAPVTGSTFELFPRLFALDPVTPREDAYRTYLLDQARQKAAELGLPAHAPNPTDYAHVSPTGGSPEAAFMASLLDAIENDNETRFINNLARFSNIWGTNHAGAKTTFIDAMSLLFVTKKFSSTATRSTYFHFILNCGQMHS